MDVAMKSMSKDHPLSSLEGGARRDDDDAVESDGEQASGEVDELMPERESLFKDVTDLHGTSLPYRSTRVRRTNMYERLKHEGIFDTLSCQFHVWVFVRQLLSHLILPLMWTLPNPRGQGMVLSYPLTEYTVINPLFVYAVIAANYFMTKHDQDTMGFSVWIPVVLFVVHRSTVALKYATLSPTEYKKFNECRDLGQCASYLNQMQLFSGWRNLDDLVLYFELSAASSRIGVKINQIYMRVCADPSNSSSLSQFRYWNAFLRGHETIDVDSTPAREFTKLSNGDYGISVFDVCIAIIRRSNNTEAQYQYSNWAVTTVTVALIVIIVLPPAQNPVDNPILVAVYCVLSARIVWIYSRAFFGFLYLAIIDFSRYNAMIKTLHCMIRLTDVMLETQISLIPNCKETACTQVMIAERFDSILSIAKSHSDLPETSNDVYSMEQKEAREETNDWQDDRLLGDVSRPSDQTDISIIAEKIAVDSALALVPRVDLQRAENSIAWIYARLAVQNFGERFRFRTDIYIAFTMLLMLVLMIVTLFSVFISTDHNKAYGSALFMGSIVMVSLFFVKLVLLTLTGSAVNIELATQCRTLAAHSIRMKTKLLRFQDSGASKHFYRERELQDALDTLRHIEHVAIKHNELKPCRVLGIRADSTLLNAMLTSAVSFYSIVFGMYSTSSSSTSTTSY